MGLENGFFSTGFIPFRNGRVLEASAKQGFSADRPTCISNLRRTCEKVRPVGRLGKGLVYSPLPGPLVHRDYAAADCLGLADQLAATQSPHLGLANRQAELMMRISSEFGFTPASRSRISTPPPDQLPLLDLTANDYEEEEPEGGGN